MLCQVQNDYADQRAADLSPRGRSNTRSNMTRNRSIGTIELELVLERSEERIHRASDGASVWVQQASLLG